MRAAVIGVLGFLVLGCGGAAVDDSSDVSRGKADVSPGWLAAQFDRLLAGTGWSGLPLGDPDRGLARRGECEGEVSLTAPVPGEQQIDEVVFGAGFIGTAPEVTVEHGGQAYGLATQTLTVEELPLLLAAVKLASPIDADGAWTVHLTYQLEGARTDADCKRALGGASIFFHQAGAE